MTRPVLARARRSVPGSTRSREAPPPVPSSRPGRGVLLAAASLVTLLTACGPEQHQLEGSLTEVVDLRWRSADVQLGENELSLRFLQPQGMGQNVVLRVTASLLGIAVDANEPINLAEPDLAGHKRGRITRSVVDDPLTEFPEVERGELTFHRSIVSGATVPGEVHITFAQGTKLANGRTVFGSFEARVE